MPHLLRPLFRRRRELLTELGRATSGALAQWHPHLHLLSADGGKTAGGSWQAMAEWE